MPIPWPVCNMMDKMCQHNGGKLFFILNLSNSLFERTTKKASKPRITGSLWGESIDDRWTPLEKDSKL